MLHLSTIGYQHHSPETFLDVLQQAGIARVIDIRQLPFSRKRGFSKKALQQALAEQQIDYMHLPALGTPKPLRDEVRRSHDYASFFAAMEALIAAQPAAVQQALDLALERPSALLCFEADPQCCHRLVVARALLQRAGTGSHVDHL